jgi:signal transduction histidine kinase
VVAVAAPLALVAWPAAVEAERSWVAFSSAAVFVFTVAGAYWVALLWVRLGPGPRRGLERSEVGGGVLAVSLGSVTAALQFAQGASDFALPRPPIMFLTALCASTYLLIPLHAPLLWRGAFEALPPEAQVRGGWLPTLIPLAGIAALLATTASVAGDRPGAVPFALAVVVSLAVLAAVRQVATMRETRRLYGQVAVTAGERRQLLTQLLDRSVDDRRFVAEQLHRQAMSAYASFTALAANQVATDRPPAVVAQASEMVGDELRRRAEALHDLVQSLRPGEGGRRNATQLVPTIRAYLATLYGDGPAPELTVDVAEDLVLDWVVETVLLQVVQEALHNVWRHARASTVRVGVEALGGVAWVRVADDGVGADPAATRAEGGGIATMQASTAVIDGRVWVEARPGRGTTVVARLGAAAADGPDGPPGVVLPLRAVGPAATSD